MYLSADVLLVTVNSHETRQLFEVFKEIHKVIPNPLRPRSRTYNDFGEINGMRVLHTLCEMGTSGLGSALQAIDESITDLQPHSVIMVGIAFGVNPEKQAIGDVLVSRQLALYEQARVGAEVNIARGDKPHASAELVNYLDNTKLYWSEANVRIGLVLSGEKLVDNPEFRDQLVAQEPEAIGGEMEGAGLYATCQKRKVDWILVKGICDWADGNKGEDKDARQALAARNAARFVATAFQFVPLKRVTNPFEQAALPEPQSNLGESENAFIGREALVETVRVWATDRTMEWILCLHGPGGVGKTRLAREAGRTLRGQFDRICLVNLESQSPETVTPALVASAMAQALGLSEGLKEPDKELAALLARQKVLLILDNFESADTVATQTWLKDFALTGIKCLMTSRKRWTVRNAARNVEVERLVVPTSATEDLNGFDGFPSVQLFRARLAAEVALAAYPQLSPDDQEALVRILQVTEGFPLAIEIVAANLLYWDGTLASLASDLGVKKLAYRHDLDESGGGPERHESMGACFQWSLNLLPDDERARFPKLGVFPYDFSPEAAQKICGVSPEDLQRWWQRSLVQRDTTSNSTRRFLLSLLREYAQDKQSDDVREEVETQLVEYYAQLVKSCIWDGRLQINDDIVRARLDAEWRTIIAVQPITIRLLRLEQLADLLNIFPFLRLQGLWLEWTVMLENSHSKLSELEEKHINHIDNYMQVGLIKMKASNCTNLGNAYRRQGRFKDAVLYYNRGLDIFTSLGDSNGIAQTLISIGNVHRAHSHFHDAIKCFGSTLRIFHSLKDTHGTGKALGNLGLTYLAQGFINRSSRCFEKSLSIFRYHKDYDGMAIALGNLGLAYTKNTQFKEALEVIAQAKLLRQKIGDMPGLGKVLFQEAIVYKEAGMLHEALQEVRKAVGILEQTQDRRTLEQAQGLMAQIEAALAS